MVLEKAKNELKRLFTVFAKEDIFIVAVIVLVGFGGFGLGRLSKTHEEKTPVVIENVAPSGSIFAGGEETNQKSLDTKNGKNFVASVSGSKYHLPWCASASTIKEENKIWFASEDEARAAGYSPAGNCKGL
ncbi:MAG: hypothetical protein HYY60_02095 [Parcubacteria group bacterium]|nr:hypothetical protein [Parcubacteria group bacterium]